ncbi:MAG: prephenate dehydrogenase/arogenate dehydrogenase family protein [Fimbriimonadales bacterium]|nr:prephenate dehydrogenase/arogenate dehydrogenase family protein [Fimbriimonadales bacterium]
MRLALIGLGGIGASIGLAYRLAAPNDRVLGYDTLPDALEGARAMGAIDQPATRLDACADADLIVIATPPHAVPTVLQQLAPRLHPETIITDVVSIKQPLLAWARQYLPYPNRFVGGHPIAGTEQHGYRAARADLFHGAQWVLTPTPDTDADAVAQVEHLVRAVGAEPRLMDAPRHDEEFALLSCVPHCIAFSLTAIHRRHPTLLQGGGSWRSATRVAQSDPALWTELLTLNREPTLRWLETLIQQLESFRDALRNGDPTQVRKLL